MILVIPSRLWEYLIAATLIVLAPGPSVLFTIARAISWGPIAALASVLGNVLGEFVLAALVAVGLGPILQRSHPLFLAIQWCGAAYLVFLGIDAIRGRQAQANAMAELSGGKPASFTTVKQGFVVGVLNPKSLVFFAAILPEFADHSKGHFAEQLLLMGAIFCLLALFFDGIWGVVAGSIREWLSSDIKKLEGLRMGGGCIMIGLGFLTFVNSLFNR